MEATEEIISKVANFLRSLTYVKEAEREGIAVVLEESMLKRDYPQLIFIMKKFSKVFYEREGLFNEIVERLEQEKLCAEIGIECLQGLEE